MIFSVVYQLSRCLLDCLVLLAGREASKEADLLVLRHDAARIRILLGRPRPPRANAICEQMIGTLRRPRNTHLTGPIT